MSGKSKMPNSDTPNFKKKATVSMTQNDKTVSFPFSKNCGYYEIDESSDSIKSYSSSAQTFNPKAYTERNEDKNFRKDTKAMMKKVSK